MIFQNFQELATTQKKKDCLEILHTGLEAANPDTIIPKFVTPKKITIGKDVLDLEKYSSIYSVAFGKAGDSMTRALNKIVPVKSGIVVIPKGSKSQIKGKKFKIFNSRHPKPDKTSVKAAKEVVKFLENRREDELVIFLVSGGASSLLALPKDIMLEDKIHVTELLLKSGATIQEFNCIRKHLSKIKGGKLVENIKCDGISLIMSDVEGDDMSSIASGITYKDNTTFNDALEIINKYKIKRKIPQEVMQVLENGAKNEMKKTEKLKVRNYVIANNQNCIEAMKETAKKLGYATKTTQVFGDIKDAVTTILTNISEEPNTCLIFGGETTVRVSGKGTGGRNQEMVLRILKNTQKLKKITIAAIGTDGIDGNSLFAGAITENFKIDAAITKEFLKNSDSARFFQKRKSNIITNFTHTNLMDIGLVLR